MNEEVQRKVNPRDHLRRFLAKDVRLDGRAPNTPRKISVTAGSIQTAVGSAMVKFGRTTAVAGVHATLVEPGASAPHDGVLEIVVEMLPTATVPAMLSRGHRAADDAVALTSYLHAWIVPYVQLDQLCVEHARLVWRLRLTVYVVDHDGNLEDAAALAAVAALRDVRLPVVRMLADDDDDDDDEEDRDGDGDEAASKQDAMTDGETRLGGAVIAEASDERTVALRADGLPVVVSFSLFDGRPLLDPSAEEEAVADSRLTAVFRPSGELRCVDKSGGRSVSASVQNECLQIAEDRARKLVGKLKQAKPAKS